MSMLDAQAFGETQQLGLSLEPVEQNLSIYNHFDNGYNPPLSVMEDSIYFGPQGPYLEQMEAFNSDYNSNFKFTKTFRWSPGYKQELQRCILSLTRLDNLKRAPHLILECLNSNYMLNRFKERFLDMHNNLANLRHEGVAWVEDPSLIFGTLDTIKNKIKEELEIANQLKCLPIHIDVKVMKREIGMDRYTRYAHFVHEEDCSANYYDAFSDHYLVIELSMANFAITAVDLNSEELAKIPSGGLILRMAQPLAKFMNKIHVKGLGNIPGPRSTYSNADFELRGNFTYHDGIYHPYISSTGGDSDGWNSVCLGDMHTSMVSNAINLNIAQLILQFQMWATTYTVGHTHPLNRIYTSHFGIPKEFSRDYLLKAGAEPGNCVTRMRSVIDCSMEEIDYAEAGFRGRLHAMNKTQINLCDSMECQLRDRCNSYQDIIQEEKDEEELTDEQKALIREMSVWAQTAGGING